ncbi:unnamed protein product, partial [marine sediment metagenome]
GYVGNFLTRVKSERGSSEIKHGATVIAVGHFEVILVDPPLPERIPE